MAKATPIYSLDFIFRDRDSLITIRDALILFTGVKISKGFDFPTCNEIIYGTVFSGLTVSQMLVLYNMRKNLAGACMDGLLLCDWGYLHSENDPTDFFGWDEFVKIDITDICTFLSVCHIIDEGGVSVYR